MRTRLTLRPGQNGTKKLKKKYGDRLVAVRYLYDETTHRRVKTVELIEEDLPWTPPATRYPPKTPVFVRVGYDETELRDRIKSAGARWQPGRKRWILEYASAEALGLADRIEGAAEKSLNLDIQSHRPD